MSDTASRRRLLAVLVSLAAAATLVATHPGPAASASDRERSPHAGHGSDRSAVVRDWQHTAARTIYTENAAPVPVGVLYLGFTSVAVHDAVRVAGRNRGSEVAAVAVAAHDVLAEYFPDSRSALGEDLEASLATVPDGPAKDRGIRAGTQVADRLIARRADDGRDDPTIIYDREPAPGVWQPAPGTTMLAPWLGFVDPLVTRGRLNAGRPDPLGSRAYAVDYLEVKRVGAATGADRTPYQTETALFFHDNAALLIQGAMLRHLDEHPMSLRSTTRLFAAMHGAMTDSIITAWRQKYEAAFWRPSQAIQAADTDGNPATVPDPAWTPLIPNPPYSDHVSGHASLTAPAMEVVRRLLGETTSLTLQSAVTGTERTYATLSQIEHEAFHARIWGGLHFRDAMEDGYALGHQAARLALRRIH
jgi:hypothetical protein